MSIIQLEADFLMMTPKKRLSDKIILYPNSIQDNKRIIELSSIDGKEIFYLDLYRHKIYLRHQTFQTRAKKTICLRRLDLGKGRHMNPDGNIIDSPHLHIWKEGFNDSWAYPVDVKIFTNLEDYKLTLEQFMNYSNIVEPPIFQWSLF